MIFPAIVSAQASAQTEWNGDFGNTWSNASNWTAGVLAEGGELIINDSALSRPWLDQNRSVGAVNFNDTHNSEFSIQTGPSLTLTISGGLTASGDFTDSRISLGLRGNYLLSQPQDWSVAGDTGGSTFADRGAGFRATEDENAAGSVILNANLTKKESGQLSLIGTSVSGSGNIVVQDGVLKLNAGSGLRLDLAGPGNINVSDAGSADGKFVTAKNSGMFGRWTRPVVMGGTADWSHQGGGGSHGNIGAPIAWSGTLHDLDLKANLTLCGPWTGAARVIKKGDFALSLGELSPESSGPETFSGSLEIDDGSMHLHRPFPGTVRLTEGVALVTLNAPVAGSVFVDNSGARLIINGTPGVPFIGGNLTAESGAIVTGETVVNGNVDLESATLRVKPETAGALKANGNMRINSSTKIGVDGIPVSGQPFTVLEWSGTLTASGSLTLEGTNATYRTTPVFTTDTIAKRISLTVTTANLTWTGNSNSTWNLSNTGNWTGASPQTFRNLDSVVFNDTSSANNVNISEAVRPGSVTFNTANSYEISGTGGIAGGASITKLGSGVVLLGGGSSQTFSGPVSVQDGELILNSDNALGFSSGITILSGASLDLNGQKPSTQNTGDPARSYTFHIAGDGGTDGLGALVNRGFVVQGQAGVKSLILDADATIGCEDLGRFDVGYTNMGGSGWIDGQGHELTVKASLETQPSGASNGIAFRGRGRNLRIKVATGTIWAQDFDDAFGGESGVLTVESGARAGTFGPVEIRTPVILKNGAMLHNQSSPAGGVGTGSMGKWLGPITLAGNATVQTLESRILIAGDVGESIAGRGLTKTGASVLTLGGECDYTGTTTVQEGTLLVDGAHGTAGLAPVSVESGAILGGTGIIYGSVNVANPSILAPGGKSTTAGSSTATGGLRTGSLTLASGAYYRCELNGPYSDRVTVQGNLTITDCILEVLPLMLGATEDLYIIASYTGSLTGQFQGSPPSGYSINYNTAAKRIEVVKQSAVSTAYTTWANSFPLVGGDALRTADPDHDGDTNLVEFAFGTNPRSGLSGGKRKVAIATLASQRVMTFTVATRAGTLFPPAAPMIAVRDGVVYQVEGSAGLQTWSLGVSEVKGADAAALQSGLPSPDSGWEYHSFRLPGIVSNTPGAYLRARAE